MALAALAFIGAGTDFIVSTTTRGTATGLAGATRGLVGLVILVVFQVLANWFGVVAATAVALIGISNWHLRPADIRLGWRQPVPRLDRPAERRSAPGPITSSPVPPQRYRAHRHARA